eukprot:gene17026-20283_t
MPMKPQRFLELRTSVRVVIGIKVFERRAAGTFALIVMVYLRGVNLVAGAVGTERPNTIISCGTAPPEPTSALPTLVNLTPPGVLWRGLGATAPNGAADPICNAAAMPLYQIQIPVAELYNGVAGGPLPDLPANINVDLFQIQQKVERQL